MTRRAGPTPYRQMSPAQRKTPCWGARLLFPTPPPPSFLKDSLKECSSPESWLLPKSVSGGETEAREWVRYSTGPQTQTPLLVILVGLPETQGSSEGPGESPPLPQKIVLDRGACREEKANLSAWESSGDRMAAPPKQWGHAFNPCRAPQGVSGWGLGSGGGHLQDPEAGKRE